MSIDDLRKRVLASPFQPFTLHIADGRNIPVIGRDFIFLPPVNVKGREVIVYQRDGDHDYLDAMLITGLNMKPVADVSPSS